MPHLSVPFSRRHVAAVVGLVCAPALLLSACANTSQAPGTSAGDAVGCVTDYSPGVDYFPVKSEIVDAENFSIEYHDSYQVLTVAQPIPGGDPESYVLVRCGTPTPELTGDLANATVVETPVTNLYSAATTHLPMLDELGQLAIVTGVSSGDWVTNVDVYQAVQDGAVAEFALDGEIDAEVVVGGAPDVLMTSGADDPAYPTLREAGIAVVANAEWLEPSVLGRAEWIKMVAALTGQEEKAAEVYDGIKSHYTEVAALAADEEPVKILTGYMYDGTWSMPSGGSYMGQLFRDAGGTYPGIEDESVGSLSRDFETILVENGDAQYWFINDTWVATIDDLIAQNEHYRALTAPTTGQVWNANKAIGAGGGNDYWERGVLHPNLILADLVKILHPDLLPDHEFAFYQQLTR